MNKYVIVGVASSVIIIVVVLVLVLTLHHPKSSDEDKTSVTVDSSADKNKASSSDASNTSVIVTTSNTAPMAPPATYTASMAFLQGGSRTTYESALMKDQDFMRITADVGLKLRAGGSVQQAVDATTPLLQAFYGPTYGPTIALAFTKDVAAATTVPALAAPPPAVYTAALAYLRGGPVSAFQQACLSDADFVNLGAQVSLQMPTGSVSMQETVTALVSKIQTFYGATYGPTIAVAYRQATQVGAVLSTVMTSNSASVGPSPVLVSNNIAVITATTTVAGSNAISVVTTQ